MKYCLLLSLLFTTTAFAYNPMGGHFLNNRTKDKVVLLCDKGEVAKDCEEAYFYLIDKNGNKTRLHNNTFIPVDSSQDSLYERYHMFYVLRDRVIEMRAYGPTAVFNSIRISNNFRAAVKLLFSKNPSDFNSSIKMTHKNFKAMVESIEILF